MPPKHDLPPIEDALLAMSDNIAKLLEQNTTQFEALFKHLATPTPPPKTDSTPPPPPPSPPIANIKPPKITLPTFDGSDPIEWLFQTEQYFYYSIPDTQRLPLAAFYLKGEALRWFKYLHSNSLLRSWTEFTCALELRFGPSTFENHRASLFKLRQTGTVASYQSEFECLANFVVGLPPEALLDCFLSGLRTDIQNEMALHNPQTLNQAYDLAKLVKDKISASDPVFFQTPVPPPYPFLVHSPPPPRLSQPRQTPYPFHPNPTPYLSVASPRTRFTNVIRKAFAFVTPKSITRDTVATLPNSSS